MAQMSLRGQLEAETEIKAPAAVIHEVFSCRPHHISNICPEKVRGVDLVEGDWGIAGSVILWNWVYEGKTETAKDLIEEIDYENKSMTFKLIEGDLLKKYKSMCFTFQATPKGEGSLARWTIKYEKLNEDVPEPEALLQLAIAVTKIIGASHVPQV